jgi:hypothetical protein
MKLLSLRLPDDLHAALKALAKRENRSLHSQIVYILRMYIERMQEEGKAQD